MTICERIFSLLAQDNREQQELAKHIGVSARTVSTWKVRGTDPSAEYIYKIADFFNVSTNYILTGEEFELKLKPEDYEILGLWDKMSPADRAVVKYEMYKRVSRAEPFEGVPVENKKVTDESPGISGVSAG